MKNLKLWAIAACLASALPSWAQESATNLTVEDLVAWQRITQQKIADNGEWVACKMSPWKGDATVYLYDRKGKEVATFSPADQFHFSSSSSFMIVEKIPETLLVEELKLKKTKADKMPMNTLVIHDLLNSRSEHIDSIQNYQLSGQAEWLAYQNGRKDSTLHVRSLSGKTTFHYPSVVDYGFSETNGMLYFIESHNKNKKLFILDPTKGNPVLVKEGKGIFSKLSFNKSGRLLAFLYANEKKSAYKNSQLWLSADQKTAQPIVDKTTAGLPENWVVSEHSKLKFSESSSHLYFGTSPEPRQKDTLLLAENRPSVQVWSWDEPVQYTVQQYNKEKDLKKTYTAVYNMENREMIQLATTDQPDITLANKGDGLYALTYTSRPYSVSWMWEGRTRGDYYSVSLQNGKRQLLSKADYGNYELSPKGNYAYWYAETDSCWYTISLADGEKHRLTTPQSFVAWDEDNDVPDYPQAHGCAGWSDRDEHLYLYDRYDIWQFDPNGIEKPVNMTQNGRKGRIQYRLVELDKEATTINIKQNQLLRGTNEVSKGDGYYSFRFNKPSEPKPLIAGNFMLHHINKAKNANKIIFTKETFEMYPDVHYCSMNFKKPIQLTSGYKQQENILWGTAELISWTSLDGKELEGVIYKPANFDPHKKYPMIVNFYERNSDRLFSYRMPEAHRSTVDYHMYNSNGYIVFNPDIRYTDGHPGESCYNCLLPGIQKVVAQGYVNEKAIGAQGHSWGGYQTAYLVTRTNIFAAIESGAPVVNMFSAYGGIRWGSGLARSFQYEHTQSRLGTTPWKGPEIYKENSPLFTMDKVQTPVLIMHNDSDGHVPWYQGIEYFVAMKRLGKPCWLLNYTGEPHWPMRIANRIDFQKRMQQFFNHYLKREDMPEWMKEGLPAVDEPFKLGY